MNWKSLLKPVNSLNTEEAREFMASRSDVDYQLLDVRQPREYEAEHLPGARLIPLKQLAEGLKELDEEKPVLVYCAVGGRSRAALCRRADCRGRPGSRATACTRYWQNQCPPAGYPHPDRIPRASGETSSPHKYHLA